MSDTSSDTSGSPPEDLNAAQIALRRLERERKARKEAERLLMVKSAELFTAKEASEKAQQQLALALWASRESVWRWCESEQSFEMQYFPERAPNGKLFKGNTGEVIDRIHPDDQELVRINWHLLLSGNITSIDLVFRSRFPGMMLNKPSESGTQNRNPWRWYHCRGQIVDQDKTGLANQAMGTIKDITQQRQTEDSLRIMAKAFASSQEAMLVVSSSGKVIEANDAFLKITRLDEHELDHYQLHQFLDLKPDEALLANQEAANNFEAQLTSPCCPSIPVEVSITRFQGKNSHQPNLIVTMRDISERKQAEHALQHMARHDALTNLPNRGSFTETLTPQLRELTEGDKIGLMFIDLDGFQAVNDEFGHIAADAALVTIARRLTASVPESALVSRWGGDEFVITFLLNDGQSAGLPARVLDSIQQPMPVAESNVRISASIGVAFYSTDQQEVDVTELIRRADSAMYQAKRSGKNQIRYYSDKQDAHNSRRVSLVSALVSALEHDEMDFYVQPKYNQKREIVGGEMLARWISPSRGPISPAVFIPLIEQNGLNMAFSEAVFKAGTRFASAMYRQNPNLHLAINLSAWQMLDPQLVHKLLSHCHTEAVPPSAIELEITESVFMQPDSDPISVMKRLRECGFRLAIDDFGTGYSSLSYLRDLPLDIVKIDRSFVMDADHSERALKILSAIIRMSHDLGMSVVAEGVETQEHWDLLVKLNVELFQGFLLSRPCPFEEFKLQLDPPAKEG